MNFTIDKRLLLFLTIAFVACTIIGTLLHECGHYVAARIMGFDAHISYNATWLVNNPVPMNTRQQFWFILGGPLQTMVSGTIGFLCLYFSSRPGCNLSIKNWVLVFITLFWVRQPVNFIIWLTGHLVTGKYKENNDEIKLSLYFNWLPCAILLITALAGLLIVTFTILNFIPKVQRLTVLLAGSIGGVFGFLIWFVYSGKILLP